MTLLRYLDLEGLMVTLRMSCCELRGLIVSIVQLRLVPCAIASPATTDTHLSLFLSFWLSLYLSLLVFAFVFG